MTNKFIENKENDDLKDLEELEAIKAFVKTTKLGIMVYNDGVAEGIIRGIQAQTVLSDYELGKLKQLLQIVVNMYQKSNTSNKYFEVFENGG